MQIEDAEFEMLVGRCAFLTSSPVTKSTSLRSRSMLWGCSVQAKLVPNRTVLTESTNRILARETTLRSLPLLAGEIPTNLLANAAETS